MIGDPGRAATELPPGPPPMRAGPADIEVSSSSVAGMEIRAASCRGLAHRAGGVARQDVFALSTRATSPGRSRLVAVVCDGVGSLPRSDEAASFAGRTLASLAAAGTPWLTAFQQVNAELETIADGQMATTAVALTVYREHQEWIGDVAWVGDSELWHFDDGQQWLSLTATPGDGARANFHSAEVASLPRGDGTPATAGIRLTGGALFLMSDGVANPLRWSTDVRATLARWWARPPDPLEFAGQVAFARKTHVDDRTVVGIWPHGGDTDGTAEQAGRP